MPMQLAICTKKIMIFIIVITINQLVKAQTANADSLLNYIVANKQKVAFSLVVNDTSIVALNQNKQMPLASTVKILIAVEFAKQAGKNVINENEWIPIADLNTYYLPFTDGGAHSHWLAYEKTKNHIKNDSIQLIHVARGMTIFSSNANSEYLLDLLGLDNVKNNIQLFGLKNHTAIFPLVASLFIYQNPKKINENKLLKAIKNLPEEGYCKTIYEIHKALKYDTTLLKKFRLTDLSEKMQHLWGERLTASTTADYVHLMSILNNRKFLDADSYGIVAELLEFVMENTGNQKNYTHFGMKGGSTASILTEAFYATTKKGTKIEGAYFFNNLLSAENSTLQRWMNNFKIDLTQNEIFRQKVQQLLK